MTVVVAVAVAVVEVVLVVIQPYHNKTFMKVSSFYYTLLNGRH